MSSSNPLPKENMYTEIGPFKASCTKRHQGGIAKVARKTGTHYFVVDIKEVGKRPVFKSKNLMDANKDENIDAFAGHTLAKITDDKDPNRAPSFVVCAPQVVMEDWTA